MPLLFAIGSAARQHAQDEDYSAAVAIPEAHADIAYPQPPLRLLHTVQPNHVAMSVLDKRGDGIAYPLGGLAIELAKISQRSMRPLLTPAQRPSLRRTSALEITRPACRSSYASATASRSASVSGSSSNGAVSSSRSTG